MTTNISSPYKRLMGVRYALLALAAIVVAATLLLHLLPSSLSTQTSAGKHLEPGAVTYHILTLEVEGYGRLLVNGSPLERVSHDKPFKAVVEAVPDPCYALKRLEVNGTLVNGSRLELLVAGNTTVRATFEKPLHSLLILTDAANASALVNGTLHGLPVELWVGRCDVVNVTPVPPRGYEPLNGSTLLRIERDESIVLAFRKVSALLYLTNVLAPVRVNGTLHEGDAVLEAPFNVTLLIVPLADRRGCTEYNDTHLVCVTGWRVRLFGWSLNNVTEFDYPSRVIPLTVRGDAQLKQLYVFAKRKHPVKRAEILTPEGVVEARIIPGDRWFVVPFLGEYEYLGEGWIELKGSRVGIFLEMPENWGRVRIYVRHVKPGDLPESYVGLVVRNTVDYLELSFQVPPCCGAVGEGEAVYTIDSGALEAFREPGYDPWPLGGPRDPRVDQYFRVEKKICSSNIPRMYCVTGVTQAGPGSRVLDGIREGWLAITCSGVLHVKVEVVEWRR